MPCRMPSTRVMLSCLSASVTKPTKDWLITTVGPPDCPITAAPVRLLPSSVFCFFAADIVKVCLQVTREERERERERRRETEQVRPPGAGRSQIGRTKK